jgi:hypothetical protein
MDHYGDFFLETERSISGSRSTRHVLRGPTWEGPYPRDLNLDEIVISPSDTVWCLIRLYSENRLDDAGQSSSSLLNSVTITPLTDWGSDSGQGGGSKPSRTRSAETSVRPRMHELRWFFQDATARDFFEVLNLVLNDPTMTMRKDSVREREILAKLRRIGIGDGMEFSFEALEASTQAALEEGLREGKKRVGDALHAQTIDMNGWDLSTRWGDFGVNYMKRAVAAAFAWGSGGPRSNTIAIQSSDSRGEALSGEHRYIITFNKNDLPPCRLHWGLWVIAKEGGVTSSETGQNSIGSHMLDSLQTVDNDLIIYVQHDRPSNPRRITNWLPAPAGEFWLGAYFDSPYVPLVDGSYAMPQVVRLE